MKAAVIALAIGNLLALAGAQEPISRQPLAARKGGNGPTLFRALSAKETGVELSYEFPADAPFPLMTDQYSGCGVALGDVDGDDLPDIYLTNYDQGNRLYRNLGQWRFEDITAKAKVTGEGRWCAGPSFVDIEGDGDLDLHVAVFNAPNLLYVNDGKGSFQEKARELGLDYSGASVIMAWADYDRDGDLDGYLVTHRMPLGEKPVPPRSSKDAFARGILKVMEVDGKKAPVVMPEYRDLFEMMDKGEGRMELITAGQADVLFRQEGRRFVKADAGMAGHRIGLAATWWDADDDGWPDLYVSNDYKGADQFYHNNRDGSFTDITRAALPHVPWLSMGSDVADINNDGLLDFLATDMAGTNHYKSKVGMGDMSNDAWFLKVADPPQYMRNTLYLNSGTGRFWEVAFLTGLAKSDWTWSAKFGDFDNDGWVDLFLTNGMARDFMNSDLAKQFTGWRSEEWAKTPVLKQANLAFRNRGDLRFESVGPAWGLNQVSASYGAGVGDLDRDGDLDIVTMNFGEGVSVLRNEGVEGEVLLVRLIGNGGNSAALGAKLTLSGPLGQQAQYLTTTRGFMSANEAVAHFGLGKDKAAKSLAVIWPSGHRQEIANIKGGQILTLRQPDGQAKEMADQTASPWFARSTAGSDLRHVEREFDDYQRQPLLPMKHSRMGPALAVADVNGDGRDDWFLGGAAGQPGQLRLNGFAPRVVSEPFQTDAAAEDIAAVFFDADGDGDSDLLVASGGVECEPGAEVLRPRLYRNDGGGGFTKASDALPDLRDSLGVVAAADFDRDGDQDLFLGGRIIPGRYPETPKSHLLLNEAGRFRVAPLELTLGMVTGACWADIDGDTWPDLLVAREWGSLRLFRNDKGRLVDDSSKARLADFTGWWNCLIAADLDEDGDLDLVAGNLGLNTKYHTSPEHPYRLYYGDFEGKGRKQLVEAAFEDGVLYPERGRSCSSQAMPSLKSKFPSFHSFAAATLDQVYGPEKLSAALRLEVNTFETGVFLNDGQGHFRFLPLPRLAQLSPTNGIVAMDANADGHLDLVLAQNNFSPQPETGRWDGGMGLVLAGDGKGAFRPISPSESGIVVPGDARSLATADINGDGLADLLFGINNDAMMTYEGAKK